MSELELVSTDDLIDELFSRHDHGVVCMMKVDAKPELDLFIRRWKGNSRMVIGLMFDTALCVMEEERENDCDENGVRGDPP